MRKSMAMAVALAAAGFAFGQPAAGGGNAFMQKQAYDEMIRVSGQVDQLANNLQNLESRIERLERPDRRNDTEPLKAEIASLKAQIAQLKSEMASMRGEIVNDLSGRLKKIQQASAPAPVPAKPQTRVIGPHLEYTVKSGDTLSLIAEAFGTTVVKIREMNSFRGDMLRVGQKINVPIVKK